MMNEEKILAVARYLEGDMELQEKADFEALIESDPELKEQITEYLNIHQTLKMRIAPSAEDQEVLATLSTLGKQYFESRASSGSEDRAPKVVSLKPYLKWMSVAAVLIIGLLVWAPWSAGLYEKYAISKEMSVVERGEGNEKNLEKAAEFYNSGDFKSASALLKTEYLRAPDQSMVAYYYGVSLVETDKAEEAKVVLIKIFDGSSIFKYDAAYYLALSYIKQKNNQEAISWLQKIPSGTGNFNQAQKLIKKLK